MTNSKIRSIMWKNVISNGIEPMPSCVGGLKHLFIIYFLYGPYDLEKKHGGSVSVKKVSQATNCENIGIYPMQEK
jgi:hypothetical protein